MLHHKHMSGTNVGIQRNLLVSRPGISPPKWKFSQCQQTVVRKPTSVNFQPDGAPQGGSAVISKTTEAVQTATNSERYTWTSAWYPVIPAAYLYEDRPYGFELLGIRMVVWKAAEGWRVVEDACSHRLAPLSEGYIQADTRNLMCSYHGWEFRGDGTCAKIPQITEPKACAAACNNKAACIKSFPSKVEWGLLWVWPETGPDAQARSAAAQTNVPEAVKTAKPGELVYFSAEKAWSCRETPLEYELLVENILDLSHVPFSHHGVAGNRPDAQPITMSQVGEMTADGGFVMKTSAADAGMQAKGFKSGLLYFTPPNRVHYEITYENDTHLYLTSFTTPCAPGKSRYFSRIYTDNVKVLPPAAQKLIGNIPPWVIHLQAHNVVDADMILAAGQQAVLAQKGVDGALDRAFYMPATADKAVVRFYKWLRQFSGGRVGYAGQQPPAAAANGNGNGSHAALENGFSAKPGPGLVSVPMFGGGPEASRAVTRDMLLDHYTQHTRHCKFCQEGLAFIERVMLASRIVSVAAAVGVAALLITGLNPATTAGVAILPTCLLGLLSLGSFAASLKAADTRGQGKYTFHDLHIKPKK